MKIIFYNVTPAEKDHLTKSNDYHQLNFQEKNLDESTIALADHFDVISVSPVDIVTAGLVKKMKDLNIRFIILRGNDCKYIDLAAARRLGIHVANIPATTKSLLLEETLEYISRMTFAEIGRWSHNQSSPHELIDPEPGNMKKEFVS